MMTDLIDVKELAITLDVSRQTIYNHIQKNEKELLGHTKRIERTTYLSPTAVSIIKQSLGLIQVPTINENLSVQDIIAEMTEAIRSNISNDIEQLLLAQDSKNNKLEQELQAVKEQNQQLLDKVNELIEDKNKSLWSRIWGNHQ